MRFAAVMVTSVVLLTMGASAAAAKPVAKNTAQERFDVYTGVVTAEQLDQLEALGLDRHEMELRVIGAKRGAKLQVRVETILSGRQAAALRRQGIVLTTKKKGGKTAAQRATARAAEGFNVFKRYSGPGGIQEEVVQAAAANPKIAKLETIGTTVQGRDIVALKVTKNARQHRDGRKPSVLYVGAQHAREWITPEMVRRLMHYFLDNYDDDRSIRNIVDTTELWFIPVANPDGYEWTFEPGQRFWRKNLRDNDSDGQITAADGVDLNRNFPTKWGYDNEGSSPDPVSLTYRGPSPASEPETQGADGARRARRLRVPRQLPLRRGAAALRHGLAGGHADARRPHLRGDGRRRRAPRDPRL